MINIMAAYMFMATIGCNVIPGIQSVQFPIEGCSTQEMDVMFLYFDSRRYPEQNIQRALSTHFAKDLSDFPHNKTTPRLLFADVYDRFSPSSSNVNISSWSLKEALDSNPYGSNTQPMVKQRYINVQEVIELKVTFIQRLFSEMSEVRGNVTHIAVMFLDGSALSNEESRRVPYIIKEQGTDIKIFVVLIGNLNETQTILLNDTLLVSRDIYNHINHALILAICDQCMNGWFSFRHRHGTVTLSCYRFFNVNVRRDWYSSRSACIDQNGAMLVSIESKDELKFLQTKLYELLHEIWMSVNNSDKYSQQTALFHIGLLKAIWNVAKRFQWQLTPPTQYRPLVINHWRPGKPSGGVKNCCAAWQFNRSNIGNEISGTSSTDKGFVDGWVDVACDTKINSLNLCEVILPRRIQDKNLIRMKPATNESISRVLTKGKIVKFEDNIVSLSANIENKYFLNFLKQIETKLFPLFDCGLGGGSPHYISYVYVCDYIDHCRNKRDEIFCFLTPRAVSTIGIEVDTRGKCNGIYCCDGFCLPLQWVNDGEIDCAVCETSPESSINDENEELNKYLVRNETCALICNSNDCVHFSQLNDGRQQCIGPEGPIDETIGKLETADTCYNILGHIIWAPKCVYVRDIYGAIIGCRDTSHLQNCTDFQCPDGYVKCPYTYCIPQHYLLDGHFDCPTGDDEQNDIIAPCSGNFACWNSQICLHPDLVCNGHPDCPNNDDEVDCNVVCAKGFTCVSGTVAVTDYNRSIPLRNVTHIDNRIRFMDFSGLDLSAMNRRFVYSLGNAAFLKWSNCKIQNLYEVFDYSFQVIKDLDLSFNLLNSLDGTEIDLSALQNIRQLNLSYNRNLVSVKYLQFTFLETLDLSYTGLSHLDESFLVGFPSLTDLDISFTSIVDFKEQFFSPNVALLTLDLSGLYINNYHEDFFNGLTISKHLYTSRFVLCCPQIRGPNIPHYTCHAPDEAISSCFDLLGVSVQRIFLWIVAALAILGNLTVIGYRVMWDKSVLRKGYGLFVTHLGISDFIMGVYLFIIAGADYHYRETYILYDKIWRESVVCRFAGFLATLSTETSISFVFLITLDRFLVTKFPFGQFKFLKSNTIVAIFITWTIGFVLALIPVIFKFEMFSSNAMCFGLPLTTKRLNGWQFSFGVLIVYNLFLCLTIACGQRAIFGAMSENRFSGGVSSISSRRIQDIVVAKQLSLVALFNFLCWFPIGAMGIMSISQRQISNDVYAWTTVIVLPINSAANPVLYTIPVIIAKWDKFKSVHSRTLSTVTQVTQ